MSLMSISPKTTFVFIVNGNKYCRIVGYHRYKYSADWPPSWEFKLAPKELSSWSDVYDDDPYGYPF